MLQSIDDIELRQMAKQANQRLVRLERWMKENDVQTNQAYDVARFMLEGKKRFKERISDKMTQQEKDEERYAVTAFLNNPLSQVGEAKKQQNLKKEIEKAAAELQNQMKPMKQGEGVKKIKQKDKLSDKAPAPDQNQIEGQAILTSLSTEAKPELTKTKEKQFWRIFNKAKEIGLNKSFDYRDLAKAITWRLKSAKGTTRQIVRAMMRVTKEENLNRRMLFEAIGRA